MNYIDDIYTRIDLCEIREFLLHGAPAEPAESRSSKEKIDEKEKAVLEYIRSKFTDENECEQIMDKVYAYASCCVDEYMKIGMQCGASIAVQLLSPGNSVLSSN